MQGQGQLLAELDPKDKCPFGDRQTQDRAQSISRKSSVRVRYPCHQHKASE